MDETPHYQIMPEHCLGSYGDSKLINLACDEFFRRRGEEVGLSFRERAYEYGKRAAKRRGG